MQILRDSMKLSGESRADADRASLSNGRCSDNHALGHGWVRVGAGRHFDIVAWRAL
jgi:hypothetical protein